MEPPPLATNGHAAVLEHRLSWRRRFHFQKAARLPAGFGFLVLQPTLLRAAGESQTAEASIDDSREFNRAGTWPLESRFCFGAGLTCETVRHHDRFLFKWCFRITNRQAL